MSTTIVHEEPEHFNPKIGGHLREAVFGFNDGLVSTYAVIAGLFGGGASMATILLAALATMVGGAFSMGLGTYLGNKSVRDLYLSEMEREKREMRETPDRERQEVCEIYEKKGFKGELLNRIVDVITGDKALWLNTMMREELGFGDEPEPPAKLAMTMSVAFVIGSLIVTLPYLFAEDALSVFRLATGMSLLALLVVGWLKTYFTKLRPLISIAENVAVGVLAAGGAYGVGTLIPLPV